MAETWAGSGTGERKKGRKRKLEERVGEGREEMEKEKTGEKQEGKEEMKGREGQGDDNSACYVNPIGFRARLCKFPADSGFPGSDPG